MSRSRCDGWMGNGITGVRGWGVKAVMKIKDKKKLEIFQIYSLAGATSCWCPMVFSLRQINELYRLLQHAKII